MATTPNEYLNKANGAVADTKNKFQAGLGQVEKMSHEAGEKIGSMASSFVGSTSEYLKSGEEYVKENPAKGVVIAAVTGVAVGSLLTMAFRRK